MGLNSFNRYQAFAIHLAISAAIGALVFLGIHFAWYREALFASAGGRELFFLIAGVDVTLGPLITLIVFVPGKKGLKFDLAVIATLQIAALLYGTGVLLASRPVYVVFVKDRFELVRANDYPDTELERAGVSPYTRFPLLGPRIAGAVMPSDRAERERIMFLGPAGVDLQHMPQHYVAYDAVRKDVKAASLPLSRLRELNSKRGDEISALLTKLGRGESLVRFLPMRAGEHDLTVLIDASSGEVLKIVALRPWEF